MTRTLMSVEPNTAMASGLAARQLAELRREVGGRVERQVHLVRRGRPRTAKPGVINPGNCRPASTSPGDERNGLGACVAASAMPTPGRRRLIAPPLDGPDEVVDVVLGLDRRSRRSSGCRLPTRSGCRRRRRGTGRATATMSGPLLSSPQSQRGVGIDPPVGAGFAPHHLEGSGRAAGGIVEPPGDVDAPWRRPRPRRRAPADQRCRRPPRGPRSGSARRRTPAPQHASRAKHLRRRHRRRHCTRQQGAPRPPTPPAISTISPRPRAPPQVMSTNREMLIPLEKVAFSSGVRKISPLWRALTDSAFGVIA